MVGESSKKWAGSGIYPGDCPRESHWLKTKQPQTTRPVGRFPTVANASPYVALQSLGCPAAQWGVLINWLASEHWGGSRRYRLKPQVSSIVWSVLVWDAISPLLRDKAVSFYQVVQLPLSSFRRQLVQTLGSKKIWFYSFLEFVHSGALHLLALPGISFPKVQLIQNLQSESTGERGKDMHPLPWIQWGYRWAVPF